MKKIRCKNCQGVIEAAETMEIIRCSNCGKAYKNPFYVEPVLELDLEEVDLDLPQEQPVSPAATVLANKKVKENVINTVVTPMPVVAAIPVPIADNKSNAIDELLNDFKTDETVNTNKQIENVKSNVSNDNFTTVICESCGSNDIDFISTEYGVCKSCGSKVVLKKEEKVAPTLHIHNNNSAMSDISYYGVKKVLLPEEFLRGTLIELCSNKDIPSDVFDSEFSTAIENYKHCATFVGDVSGSCSCEIGYDMVRESKYVDDNGNVKTKKENYIEWQPYSAPYAGRQEDYRGIDNYSTEEERNLDLGLSIAYEYAVVNGECSLQGTQDIIEPNQNEIQKAMECCVDKAKIDFKNKLPGDHNKNYSFSGFSKLNNIVCHTIPNYTLKYKYDGQEYATSALATTNNVRLSSYGLYPSIKEEIKQAADKKTKPLGITTLVFLIVSILTSLILGILASEITIGLGLGMIVPLFTIAFVLTIVYVALLNKFHKDIIVANTKEKIKCLEKILEDKKINALTEEEKQEIVDRAVKSIKEE